MLLRKINIRFVTEKMIMILIFMTREMNLM
nr:MAG TPA: hypothetical protein [Bacteriophage sp.]